MYRASFIIFIIPNKSTIDSTKLCIIKVSVYIIHM